jgi:transcriptional regulator with XRE-family HTH domain
MGAMSVKVSEKLQWTRGDRMRKSRITAGVSTNEMAEYLGVTRTMVSRYETDRCVVRPGYLRLWSIRCGVPLEWIQYGEETPPPKPPKKAAINGGRYRPLRGRDSNSQPNDRWMAEAA